jgi:hypothetical protein
MVKRNLKVEDIGDRYGHGEVPAIRLKGKWLKRAGFHARDRVEVEEAGCGQLIIRRTEA